MKPKLYKGHIIERCGINSSGMRYSTLSSLSGGYLRADTLAGLKQLIKQVVSEHLPKPAKGPRKPPNPKA